MRIYLENVGERGFTANEGAAIGPRKDGGIVLHLTRSDLDAIRRIDDEEHVDVAVRTSGVLVRFDHPDYDASLVPDKPTNRAYIRLFQALRERAEKHLRGREHAVALVDG
jgi:hypothetical protein